MAQVKQNSRVETWCMNREDCDNPWNLGDKVPSGTADHHGHVFLHNGEAVVAEMETTNGDGHTVEHRITIRCTAMIQHMHTQNHDASAHDSGGLKQAWYGEPIVMWGDGDGDRFQEDVVVEADDEEDPIYKDLQVLLEELRFDIRNAFEVYQESSGHSAAYQLLWIDFLLSQCRCLELQIALDSEQFTERFPERGE